MSAIVEVEGLRKVYKKLNGREVAAVQGLDLVLGKPGTVHGFLGPNGAGKTTTIRCLLGLIRPSSGTTRLFGHEGSSFAQVSHRVGAIVENPKMFPHFSGRKNLRLLAQLAGIPKSEVERVLNIVGLHERGDDSFKSYSLGMKQRLAIAAALLKNPELLILDEPANGLDPAGIAEMRVLIRAIADEGRAVLVSSHQLAEIEQVCDEVTIIRDGTLVRSGSLEAVRANAASDSVILTIDDQAGAAGVLQAAGVAVAAGAAPGELLLNIEAERTVDVSRILAQAGLYLRGLRVEKATLEQAFLNLTSGPAAPPASGVPGQPLAAPPGIPPDHHHVAGQQVTGPRQQSASLPPGQPGVGQPNRVPERPRPAQPQAGMPWSTDDAQAPPRSPHNPNRGGQA